MTAEVDRLRRLSALLDEAMDLDAPALATWLSSLGDADCALRPALEAMLARRDAPETADLVGRGPAMTSFAGDAAATPDCEFGAGDRIGPYLLERLIGQGGMGEVWLAHRSDGQLARAVALKLPRLGSGRSVLAQRFARERDIVGSLAHPSIARLYDAGVADDGQPFLALEYVDGVAITAFCDGHALDLRGRVALWLQVADAVQYAHANLVVHRDLKPSNVLVTAARQAMLLDFGIAKLLEDDATTAAETELTRLGGRAMTLHYAAPEQISGAPISIATDVWALGVLAYELFCGRRPFRGAARTVEQAILAAEPDKPSGVPADLATILMKALKKLPAERYTTADAFAADVRRWRDGEAVLAQPDSAWYRTRKFVSRNRLAVTTAVGVAAVVLGASGIALRQAQLAREQAALAERQSAVARTEAATAEAVQGFLESVFRANSGDQADPAKARQATAEQLLDRGAERIGNELQTAPAAKLRVLKTLGDMYEDMGRLDRSARLHEQRGELALRTFGEGSNAHLSALADQTNVLVFGGEVERGEAVIARAQALADRRHDVDPSVRIDLDIARGSAYRVLNDVRGLPFAERAVALTKARPADSRRVQALDMLGDFLAGTDRKAEAVAVLEEAIRVGETLQGAAASTLPDAYTHLAQVRAALNDRAGAEQAYRRAIELTVRNSGETSSQTAIQRANFAQKLASWERLPDALEQFDIALRAAQAWPESPEGTTQRAQLTMLRARAERTFGRIESSYAELDRVERSGQLSGHARMAAVAGITLALSTIDLGRYDEAERRLGRLDAALAKQGPAVAGLREDVDWGRLALAEARGDVDAARAVLARLPDPARAPAQAEIALQAGDPAEAERIARAAIATSAAPESLRTARLQMALAGALLAQRRGDEAVAFIEQALALRRARLDPALSPTVASSWIVRAEAAWQARDGATAASALGEAERVLARHPELAPHFAAPARALRTRMARP